MCNLKLKKVLCGFVAGTMVAGALAGCSKSGEPTESSAEATQETTEGTSAEETTGKEEKETTKEVVKENDKDETKGDKEEPSETPEETTTEPAKDNNPTLRDLAELMRKTSKAEGISFKEKTTVSVNYANYTDEVSKDNLVSEEDATFYVYMNGEADKNGNVLVKFGLDTPDIDELFADEEIDTDINPADIIKSMLGEDKFAFGYIDDSVYVDYSAYVDAVFGAIPAEYKREIFNELGITEDDLSDMFNISIPFKSLTPSEDTKQKITELTDKISDELVEALVKTDTKFITKEGDTFVVDLDENDILPIALSGISVILDNAEEFYDLYVQSIKELDVDEICKTYVDPVIDGMKKAMGEDADEVFGDDFDEEYESFKNEIRDEIKLIEDEKDEALEEIDKKEIKAEIEDLFNEIADDISGEKADDEDSVLKLHAEIDSTDDGYKYVTTITLNGEFKTESYIYEEDDDDYYYDYDYDFSSDDDIEALDIDEDAAYGEEEPGDLETEVEIEVLSVKIVSEGSISFTETGIKAPETKSYEDIVGSLSEMMAPSLVAYVRKSKLSSDIMKLSNIAYEIYDFSKDDKNEGVLADKGYIVIKEDGTLDEVDAKDKDKLLLKHIQEIYGEEKIEFSYSEFIGNEYKINYICDNDYGYYEVDDPYDVLGIEF